MTLLTPDPSGSIRPEFTLGETDDFGDNIIKGSVYVHDLHATFWQCLGIDHAKLTFRFQGREFRLTDAEGPVVEPILARGPTPVGAAPWGSPSR